MYYTILMNKDKMLVTSKRVDLYEGDNLADKIRFLFPQTYKDINLGECIVHFNYIDLAGEECSEVLVKDNELYKNRLSYRYPVDSKFTELYGDIVYDISFSDGSDVLFHTESHVISIIPRPTSIIIPEDSSGIIIKDIRELKERIDEFEEDIKNLELPDNVVYVDTDNEDIIMSPTVMRRWLEDKNGNKIAPKTLSSQVITNDGKTLDEKIQENKNELDKKIDAPTTALIGQILEVDSVDKNGKPVSWKASNMLKMSVEQTEIGVNVSIEDKNGVTTTASINHGENGKDGKDGENGNDGKTPYIDKDGYVVYDTEVIPPTAVKYVKQELTDEQKTQVMDNIGAASKIDFDNLTETKAEKSYVAEIFEELKRLILEGNTVGAVAVLDQAILDLSILA